MRNSADLNAKKGLEIFSGAKSESVKLMNLKENYLIKTTGPVC